MGGTGNGRKKIEREHNILRKKRYAQQIENEKKRRLEKYLYKLKKDGLLSNDKPGIILLSEKGKNKLRSLEKNKLLDKNVYKRESSETLIIISYDLPTAFNRERDILRNILKKLGFSMVHKSVWIGKVKLPQRFILCIEKMKIIEYIEILEVTKSGSLKSIS